MPLTSFTPQTWNNGAAPALSGTNITNLEAKLWAAISAESDALGLELDGLQLQIAAVPTDPSPIVTVAGAHPLVLADSSDAIYELTSNSPNAFTLPSNATSAIPIGSSYFLVRIGTGLPTITAGSGATIKWAGTGNPTIAPVYGSATVYKRGTNDWWVGGSLA